MDQWFYSRFNQQLGPVSWDELRARALRGEFTASDLVWKEGMANWVAASTIPGLIDPAPTQQYVAPVQPQQYPQPGQYGAPAQPVGYYGGGMSMGPRPSSPLVWAILTTFCCCQLFGIVAIVYSAQVNSKWDSGDYQGAMDARGKAVMWCWIAAVCGMIAWPIIILAQIGANGGFR